MMIRNGVVMLLKRKNSFVQFVLSELTLGSKGLIIPLSISNKLVYTNSFWNYQWERKVGLCKNWKRKHNLLVTIASSSIKCKPRMIFIFEHFYQQNYKLILVQNDKIQDNFEFFILIISNLIDSCFEIIANLSCN